jgi:hypothetical protein
MLPVRTRSVRRNECAIRPERSCRMVAGYQMTEWPLDRVHRLPRDGKSLGQRSLAPITGET